MMTYYEKFIAVVKSQGKILRERGDVVTLPFGSEYSLLLKNKNSKKALVSVEIDGKSVLDNGGKFIIQPNSEFELEGFVEGVRGTNKFKFIQKTQQISDYRGDRIDDGLIRIEFTYEKEIVKRTIIEETFKNIKNYEEHHHHHHHHHRDYYTPWHWGTSICNNVQSSNSNNDLSQAVYACSSEPTLNCGSNIKTNSLGCYEDLSKPVEDEGITVKGSKSFQNFNYGSIGELEESSSVIILKLRGVTEKENTWVQAKLL